MGFGHDDLGADADAVAVRLHDGGTVEHLGGVVTIDDGGIGLGAGEQHVRQVHHTSAGFGES